MSVLDDIANAFNRYPEEETTIEVINVARANGSNDTDVNAGEVWDFQVKLTNNGHVDMTNVSLHILGLSGTTVRLKAQPPNQFATGIVSGNMSPGGGGGTSTSDVFQFKAPPDDRPAGTQLFHIHIQSWSAGAGFDHFFSNHTKDDSEAQDLGITYPRAFYTAEVFPA